MRSIAFFLASALGAAQAGPMRAPAPDSSARAVRAPDLDLAMDLGEETSVPQAPVAPEPWPAWKYWAAFGTAAAAGSAAGWLWYETRAKPESIRNEQVFTDER